jgi:hypothetical protein
MHRRRDYRPSFLREPFPAPGLTSHAYRQGAIPIHNNLTEQQMKRIALGRKNYLFVGNERGGRSAAILASITSTCRRHDIDTQLYLTQLLANLPSTPMSQLDQWLPDVWKLRQNPGIGADAHARA